MSDTEHKKPIPCAHGFVRKLLCGICYSDLMNDIYQCIRRPIETIAKLPDIDLPQHLKTHIHTWSTYQGFTDTYQYCKDCGVKEADNQ